MSAFAVLYNRLNVSVNPDVFGRIMNRLEHRGPDGSRISVFGNISMGHWHFWTTPEEVDECQPLELGGTPFKLVFDGRLDNRSELLAKLNINQADRISLSDGTLVLHAFAHWGKDCVKHFIGEFAFVLFDVQQNELFCARDPLGDRTLFFAFQGGCLVIASEPWAVTGAFSLAPELNESAVAHYFALQATEDGQTLFKNVYELFPAHVMAVNTISQRTWRYWQPDPTVRLRDRSDEEYAEEFRSLLEESIRCRLRSTTPVGVSMSGGLDSAPVACLAARMLTPQPLTTISYVFDELTDCDERQYINAVREKWGLRSIQIPCDDAWPFRDWQHWPYNPNQPERNQYRLLWERAYKSAQKSGLRVLFTGNTGDRLYIGDQNWLVDLIASGQPLDAIREMSIRIRKHGLRRTLMSGHFLPAARRLLNTIPGGRHIHRQPNLPDWLTPFSAKHLPRIKAVIDPAFEPHSLLLGKWDAQTIPSEIFYASRYAIELRDPFHDRRLVEYVLSLPVQQQYWYYRGYYKPIMRNAMQNILPEVVRNREQLTTLLPLFFRGYERERTMITACFQDPNAAWRKYVREDWFTKRWGVDILPEKRGMDVLLPRLCLSYAMWHKYFTSIH